MRHFVYFSSTAQTSGKALKGDLMKAGRIDIAIHSLIQGVFLSHDFREDVVFHMIFYGQPDPPKHIEISVKDKDYFSKKDIAGLLKKLLYKYKESEKTEVLPGCWIEKKSFEKVVQKLSKENKIFILDKKGAGIRDVEIPKDCVFVIGDHNGFPKKELKRIKGKYTSISVGPKMYFASQVVAIINNELDLRGI